jgi:hypothetical protein
MGAAGGEMNSYTEEEAKKKVCKQVMATSESPDGVYSYTKNLMCIGSICMKWVWDEDGGGRCGMVRVL